MRAAAADSQVARCGGKTRSFCGTHLLGKLSKGVSERDDDLRSRGNRRNLLLARLILSPPAPLYFHPSLLPVRPSLHSCKTVNRVESLPPPSLPPCPRIASDNKRGNELINASGDGVIAAGGSSSNMRRAAAFNSAFSLAFRTYLWSGGDLLSLREMIKNQTSRGRRRLESMDSLRRSQTCGVTSSLQLQSNVSLVVLPVAELNDSVSNLFDDRSRSGGKENTAAQNRQFLLRRWRRTWSAHA